MPLPDYSNMIHDSIGFLFPNGAPIVLFDFPNHANVGDSAIWLGEERYIKTKIKSRLKAVYNNRLVNQRLPNLSKETLILINGGGNLGDIWPRHQILRERLISHYWQNRIIQLPQSIHFQNSKNFEKCRKIFNDHKDFHLVLRDYTSLELARRLHDGPSYLCPDMALCLGKLPRPNEPRHSIIGLLRTDKEKVTADPGMNDDFENLIYTDWLNEPKTLTKMITAKLENLLSRYPRKMTMLKGLKRPFYYFLAKERVKRGCDILCSGKVVITDRLHGHILCTLMEIPHVVLDNSYRKIGNFREAWNTGERLCLMAGNLQDALKKAHKMLNFMPKLHNG